MVQGQRHCLFESKEAGESWSYLDMLLEILGALEGLAAELAFVRLERDVNTDVRGDVITLDGGGAARVPLASEVQVVGALAADMALTDMLLGSWSASVHP